MKIKKRKLVFSLPLTLAWTAYILVFLVGVPIYAHIRGLGFVFMWIAVPFGLWFAFNNHFEIVDDGDANG